MAPATVTITNAVSRWNLNHGRSGFSHSGRSPVIEELAMTCLRTLPVADDYANPRNVDQVT